MPVFPAQPLLIIVIPITTRKSSREPRHVTLNRTLVPQKLDIGTIDQELALVAFLDVFFAAERGEAPVLANDDLLAAGELVLRAAEGFDGCCAVYVANR